MMSVCGDVKIIDFGFAVDVSLGERVQMVGSPSWMAPEMIRGEPHSLPVDVWGFVVSILELANQRPPNMGNVKKTMFLSATVGLKKKFVKGKVWSEEFKVFSFLFFSFLFLSFFFFSFLFSFLFFSFLFFSFLFFSFLFFSYLTFFNRISGLHR